ncbi:MAG: hypothetical protein KVP17_005100 [Porospora cf. gigantea B]|uniref:uncharacterized protein n=1 Tax=Porospora cf. gigantea B TaxID=2853592 RepID=UPI003571A5FC|nr:MAG: hypothetical protein KVP17_005100 [Porospora cf. gigantea B]
MTEETPHGKPWAQQVEEDEGRNAKETSHVDFNSETPLPFDMSKKKKRRKKGFEHVDLNGCAYCSGGCSMCNPALRNTSDAGREAAPYAASTSSTVGSTRHTTCNSKIVDPPSVPTRIRPNQVKFRAMKSSLQAPPPARPPAPPPVMFAEQAVASSLDPLENPTPSEAQRIATCKQTQAHQQRSKQKRRSEPLLNLTDAEKGVQAFDFGDFSSLAPEEAGPKLTSFCAAVHAYLCLLIPDKLAVGKIVGVMADSIQTNPKDISSWTGKHLLPSCVTVLEALHASNQLLTVSTESLKERLQSLK